MKIQESGENYLETILILKNRNGYVRSVDIANELSFTKASVSRAMSILRKAGLIVIEKSGNIVLTESGFARASAVYERHTVLSDFFRKVLGVDPETAVQDACRIEHVISQESFDKIKEYIKDHGSNS